MKYVCGADVGGTAIKIGIFTCQGDLINKYEFPTDVSDSGSHILKQLAGEVKSCIAAELTDDDTVMGLGIGIPGAVSDGNVVNECINIGWHSPVDVTEEMRRLIDLPVAAINDADAAAMGEFWKGSAAGYRSAVFVTIGTGVGAGIISNGRVVVGAGGYSGEIGHITVNPFETRRCNCGKKGCLELYCAAPGMVYTAKKALRSWNADSLLKGKEDLSAKDIFDAAKAGDEFALSRVDEFGLWMGIGLGNVAQTMDPEVFVIGGGVSRAGEILLDAIRKHYPDWVYGSLDQRQFVLATLGHDAGIYGAAKLILDAVHIDRAGADVQDKRRSRKATKEERSGEIHRIDEDDAAQCFMPRASQTHKGDYGYVALAGGSFRYSGAIRLAGMAQQSVLNGMGGSSSAIEADQDGSAQHLAELAQSAVTAGAGVVMLAVPRSLCYAVRPDILESTIYPLSDADGELVFIPAEWDELIRRCKVIAIGMGIGNTKETAAAVRYLLENYTGRLVIDADGLNALADMRITDIGSDKRPEDASENRLDGHARDGRMCSEGAIKKDCVEILRRAHCDIVLTPHPAEMARLCGCTTGEVLEDPVRTAQEFAAQSGTVVLLKGSSTVVSDGTRTYMSDRGCAGMATGGSGDVLSGVMAAMLGYWNPESIPLCKLAACAAWTAGLAGEMAQKESCDIAMKASDTARHVKDAVTYLRKLHE